MPFVGRQFARPSPGIEDATRRPQKMIGENPQPGGTIEHRQLVWNTTQTRKGYDNEHICSALHFLLWRRRAAQSAEKDLGVGRGKFGLGRGRNTADFVKDGSDQRHVRDPVKPAAQERETPRRSRLRYDDKGSPKNLGRH